MAYYTMGLDIGQSADYTALAVIKRVDPNGETNNDRAGIALARMRQGLPDVYSEPIEYHLLALDRIELGMKYPSQVEVVQGKLDLLEGNAVAMAVDKTGVGAAVYDLFADVRLEYVSLVGILISPGNEVKSNGDIHSVPKRDLISSAVVLFEQGRLKVSKRLKLWDITKEEMVSFDRKINEAGRDTYGNNGRLTPHDDLVLAVSMACWYATYQETHVWRNA